MHLWGLPHTGLQEMGHSVQVAQRSLFAHGIFGSSVQCHTVWTLAVCILVLSCWEFSCMMGHGYQKGMDLGLCTDFCTGSGYSCCECQTSFSRCFCLLCLLVLNVFVTLSFFEHIGARNSRAWTKLSIMIRLLEQTEGPPKHVQALNVGGAGGATHCPFLSIPGMTS